MRATVGILGILGLSVAVATAQSPSTAHTRPPQRRAVLLPPQAIHPSEIPVIARAAAEELAPSMTPVVRSTSQAGATAPGWLNGTDSNVRPASGTGGNNNSVRPLSPRTSGGKDASGVIAKGIEKLKGTKNARPEASQRAPAQLPSGVSSNTANANTPFRGTSSTGAPVYAGPPAYRWYGWGSVTPGANPHAPTGQYPPASANWYSITGATPGAFPVAVTHPERTMPGTEPPVYVPAQGQRPVTNWNAPSTHMPAHGYVRGAEQSPPATTPVEYPHAEQPAEPRMTPTPTIAVPPPIVLPAITPTPIVVPGTTDQEPPIRPIGIGSQEEPLPVISPTTTGSALPAGDPAALPVSVVDEKSNWQPTDNPGSSGEWGPADGKPQSRVSPRPNGGHPHSAGAKTPGQPIARGQGEVSRADPAIALISRLCYGRATAVDVRWTGGEKLRVTFDCRTAAAAQQLVKEICSRPELAPLQIEFSVIVK
jgi:hypothetical protein